MTMSRTIPLIFAHRGASYKAPENTLPAFLEAVEMGADALETDVHWTKDGVIVVSHDADVDRMSNGSGAIAGFTYDELKRLDFGYRFTQDGGKTYPYRNCGVSIMTLAELLNRFPHMRFNIDIKPEIPPSLQTFVQTLCECDALSRVIAASFHHTVLGLLRQMNKSVKTSASQREIAQALVESFLPLRTKLPYTAAQIPRRAGRLPVASARFIQAMHRRGVDVHVWTINDEREMMQLFRRGVDGIVTNRPDAGVKIRNEFLLKYVSEKT